MSKYTRFFEANSPTYILESIYINSYADLDCYAIKEKESVIILFEDLEQKKCQEIALELFKNNEKFNTYYLDFKVFLDEAREKANKLINNNQAIELIDLFLEFLKLYRYTESFYTELSYKTLESSKDNNLKINLKLLEEIKTKARKFLNLFFNGQQSYLSKIANKSENKEKFLYSSIEEIREKKQISQEEINIRKKNHILDSSHKIHMEDSLKYNEIKKWKDSLSNCSNFLKGTAASKGEVTGKAYVLSANFTNFDELDEIIEMMPKDIVLVSETTAPDIVRACYKAKAIVTNQGGLGSHAAIISRELQIPCVVGTKIATSVINTGDLITVNGNKGVVLLNDK